MALMRTHTPYPDQLECPECSYDDEYDEFVDGWKLTCPDCGFSDRTGWDNWV